MKPWVWLLDLFYPQKCPFCQSILEKPQDCLCTACAKRLPWLAAPHDCRRIDFTGGCVSPLRYQGRVRDAIHRYKFSGITAYSRPFGKIMADCVRTHPEIRPELVTWVPVSKKRRRERGFDQSELLARSLGERLQLPVCPTLNKGRHTSRQSMLDQPSQRRANVKGAYQLRKDASVAGKNILLVDDVVTSGATLEECAAILRIAGAKQVWCVTLAQAAKKDGKNS